MIIDEMHSVVVMVLNEKLREFDNVNIDVSGQENFNIQNTKNCYQ